MPNPKRLCLYVQVENHYNSYELVAHVGEIDQSGKQEFLGVSWSYGDPGEEYDGLKITAYLGNTSGSSFADEERGIWGLGFTYQPFQIKDVRQAKAIAQVMTKIEKGLEKANSTLGYIEGEGKYAEYLLRIAAILRIDEIFVAATKEPVWPFTGSRWKKVDGSALQYYIKDVDALTREGKRSEMIHR